VRTVTVWDYKTFKHQAYPAHVGGELFAKWRNESLQINRHTPITSMGSCFARNIGQYLLSRHFNYLITEQPPREASAHWDQVFNTACMRQIFEYTFADDFHPVVRWWPKGDQMQDPYRRNILYDRETCEEDFQGHRRASREALTQAKVVILPVPYEEDLQKYASFVHAKDLHVLAAAVEGESEFLLTLDRRHILAAAEAIEAAHLPIRILRPGDFIQRYYPQHHEYLSLPPPRR